MLAQTRDQRSVDPLSACAEPSTARRSTATKERRDDIVNPEITTPPSVIRDAMLASSFKPVGDRLTA